MFGRWKQSPLERAVVDAADRPSNETRAALIQQLCGGTLYVAVREPVALDIDAGGVLRSAANIAVLTGAGPNAPVLLGFTTEKQMRRRNADAHPLRLPLVTLHDLIVQQNHGGLVINPEDKWVFLAREELASALQRAAQTGR